MKKIIFCIVTFSVVSCNFFNKKDETKIITKNKNTDIFYTENEGLDYIRFPLIKPFDITSIDVEESWLLGRGHDTDVYADYISELIVFEKYFFLHSKCNTIVDNDSVDEGWYVLNTDEKGFLKGITSEKNFLKGFTTKENFIKSLNINSEKLNWQKPADLYKQFKETGCLHWIPNCK